MVYQVDIPKTLLCVSQVISCIIWDMFFLKYSFFSQMQINIQWVDFSKNKYPCGVSFQCPVFSNLIKLLQHITKDSFLSYFNCTHLNLQTLFVSKIWSNILENTQNSTTTIQ